MSFDLAIWYPDQRLSHAEASQRYHRLCEGDANGAVDHPSVEAFYRELTASHPELDDVPEDRIDDHDYCPWCDCRKTGTIFTASSSPCELERILDVFLDWAGVEEVG